MPKLYNHAFTVAFTIENGDPDGECTNEEMLAALKARVRYLEGHPDEILESAGAPFDTYEVTDERKLAAAEHKAPSGQMKP